ncbi:tyrosine-type recombinase/integrase [Roseibium polysiphoniae]|uniref:tyrosine-type recombinase/integrase n=1 Tax=Roseibium polysiphoniae TaxID=2571221 RepID=UPI001FEBFA10|nr:tyrosine-type recombinase/integrase [Roseibium polysiphoniae]
MSREKSRHGRVKWFFRVGKGPRVRLPDMYSTDPSSDFMQAYNAAMEGRVIKTKPKSRYKKETLGWLFDVYQQSSKFADLAEGTRRARANIIKGIVSNAGTAPLSDITPKVVRKGRERRAKTPEAANNFLKTMKAAFAWGVDSGLIDIDPTKDVKKLISKTDGFHTWTPEEIEQFENRHALGTMARLALDIMTYTGLRRQDASVIGRQHIKNGQIHFKASKNDEWVYLPIVPPLQKSIDASEAGDMTLLLTSRGKPFSSPASFGNWFRDRCVEAGVPGRAHGLRKAGAVLAAERGATVSQLKAVFGWTSDDMASLYTKRADRKKMGLETGGLLDRS